MLLVDTSNVLYVTGVLPQHMMGDGAGLDLPGLARLISTSRYGRRRAVLVSDGVGPSRANDAALASETGAPEATNTAPSGKEVAGLDVVYAGANQEADDVIELLLARDTAPRRLLVVSTDRRLIRAARRRRAQSITSEAFLRHLASDASKPRAKPLPGYATQVPLNEYAVGYWMSLFGYGSMAEEAPPGERPVSDVSRAAQRGLDEERQREQARKRASSPHAHERLKIPKDLLGANGKPSASKDRPPPPPKPRVEPPPPPPPADDELPADVKDLLKDSGLSIDPADLDMDRWLPQQDTPPPSS
ncbi:MAG: NYN domain-containing protein [Phycisphaerales bacterium]|jgi:hypothetical protein